MYATLRAAGFAAAAIGAALSPAFADPTQAFDFEAPQAEPGYIAHASATTEVPALPDVSAPNVQPEAATPAPVADHAATAVAADPSSAAEEARGAEKRSLISLVSEYASTRASDAELECLAGAIYFEAKGEPLAGQLAVAEVIINRTKSGRYPTSMCGVVKQRGQFSFVHGGRFPAIARDSANWRKAVAIAQIAVKDLADSPAEDALAFHATYVSPHWRMKRVATVGNHVFYR